MTQSHSAAPLGSSRLTLISHALCPYVQRAAIVLAEKGVPFERMDIDLAAKPGWFLEISPLGKTPVLLVRGEPIFESAVICEYLDETEPPRLHPGDPLERARHRGWVEFGSHILNTIWAFYTAPDERHLAAKAADLHASFQQVERVLPGGPYFAGARFCIVDAVFGPVFRYFDVFDEIDDFGVFAGAPRVAAWRVALARRPSVKAAVRAEYPQLLRKFLVERNSALSRRMEPAPVA
jgi:glutathione S-transferase